MKISINLPLDKDLKYFGILLVYFLISLYQELHFFLENDDKYAYHDYINIKEFKNYEVISNELNSKIMECTILLKEFWTGYIRGRLYGNIVSSDISCGLKKILLKNESLQNFFNDHQKLFENNKEISYIFCCYLKHTMNDEIRTDQIITQMKTMKKSGSVKVTDSEYFKVNL